MVIYLFWIRPCFVLEIKRKPFIVIAKKNGLPPSGMLEGPGKRTVSASASKVGSVDELVACQRRIAGDESKSEVAMNIGSSNRKQSEYLRLPTIWFESDLQQSG